MAEDPKMSRAVLEAVRENSVSALDEMRTMIGLLRAASEAGPESGLDEYETIAPARLAELSRLVESARATGMEVVVESTVDSSAGLPAAVDLTAYRIAQEALTNAVKHAPGGCSWTCAATAAYSPSRSATSCVPRPRAPVARATGC